MKPGKTSARVRFKFVSPAALLVWALLSLFLSFGLAQQATAPKRVLALHWYNKDHPWNVKFDEGFQAFLKSAPSAVEYYPEYLESNRFPGESQSRLLRDYLRQKYADRTIDVVVANSDASLEFLLRYRADLFPRAPIVFVAVRHPTPEELVAGPGLTGIVNVNAHRKTLDLALRLHPGTKQVFVISGTLQHDKKFETLAREELEGYESGVLITYLTDLAPDELITQMKRLPEGSVVLYVWQQSRSTQGEILESVDLMALIARSASVPIYELSHEIVDSGVVGGYIATAGAQGTKVAEIVLRIANGVRAQDIPVEDGPSVPVFDWRQLKRWGISEDKLPPNSVVRFKEVTFWEHYKWHVVGVVSLCVVQSLLILALLGQRIRRRRVEEALRENQERLARTEHFSLVIATHVDLDGRWLRVPPTLCELLGYTEEELLAGHFKDVTHLDDFEADWSQCQRLIRGEIKSFDLEKRYLHKDGHIIWVYLNCSIVTDAKGKPIHFLTYIRDITRRKEVEEALRESEERYRAIVEAQTELICKLLPDGTLTYVNEPYAGYFGRTSKELVGTSFRPFIPAEEEEHINVFMASFNPSNPVATIEHRVLLPSGERRWHQWTDRAIYDDQGRLLEFQCIGRDITRRKLAEEELTLLQTITMEVAAAVDLTSALEVVLRRVCERTGWVLGQVWFPRQDGTVLDCGPAWCSSASGLEEFRVASQPITLPPGVGLPGRAWSSHHPAWIEDVTLDANFPRAAVAEAVGLKAALAIPILSGNGVIAVIEFFLREPRLEDERLVKVIATIAAQLDLVIERKLAEEALRDNEEALRQSYERIEDLAGRLIVAQEEERKYLARELHDDLSQQIAALAIGLGKLGRQLVGAGGAVREQIAKLEDRVVSMAERIRQLSHELHSSALEHVGLAEALRNYCSEFAAQEGIAVDLEIQDNAGPLSADAALCLYRVAQESLRNIARHSGAKSAEVAVSSAGNILELRVSDRGRGFDLKQAGKQSGLGLVSMEERVKLLHGSFEVRSQPGSGTELAVHLPLIDPYDSGAKQEKGKSAAG